MLKVSLSRRQFRERSRQGNLIPVFRQLLGDTLTPISIFLRFEGDRSRHSFLLESVINNEQIGRNSFIGVNPRAVLRGRDRSFRIESPTGDVIESFEGDPLEFLKLFMESAKPVADARLPAFFGGAVGFLSYDLIRYYEKLPDQNIDDLQQDDAYLLLTDESVIVDHVERHVRLVVNVRTEDFESVDRAYDHALQCLDRMEERLRTPRPDPEPPPLRGPMPIESNMTADEFRAIVSRAREYIHAGDIFQVVLSKRYSFRPGIDAFSIYRGLRAINPSPYMYYLNLGPFQIVGSSPEILVRLQNSKVVLRPIAGTRRRGRTPAEDLALEQELLSDQKEIAEHIMLVDLGRNDVGRVSEPGSVRVTEFKAIERYSHVMHIVSHCEGKLAPDLHPYEALRASLPAGTVSGAPKIRSMEIIDELENRRRGIYAGCIGYFNYNGDFDTAISIRTMVFRDDVCYLQAGAGVVFDSKPELECEEVANKVRGMLAAVRFARRGFQ